MKTQLPMNVKLRIGPVYGEGAFILSLTQEDKNDERLNVALIRNGQFIPTKFWAEANSLDGDVVSYVDGEGLAKIIAAVSRLAEFSAYAQD